MSANGNSGKISPSPTLRMVVVVEMRAVVLEVVDLLESVTSSGRESFSKTLVFLKNLG
jgi:hypothetical protein